MNEQELRAIVRDAIARHAAAGAASPRAAPLPSWSPASAGPTDFSVIRQHASHGLFAVPAGADTGGPCVIEPAVACNHCGYCKSYGH